MSGLLLWGCQSQPERAAVDSPQDTEAVLATIDSLRATYEQSVAAGDFQAMVAMLAPDAVMVGPGGPAWDSLRSASAFPWPPGATFDITPIETVVMSEDWAYEFGTSVATYLPDGASNRRAVQDTYLLLFRHTPNGWKIYREVASSNLPPEPTQGG